LYKRSSNQVIFGFVTPGEISTNIEMKNLSSAMTLNREVNMSFSRFLKQTIEN